MFPPAPLAPPPTTTWTKTRPEAAVATTSGGRGGRTIFEVAAAARRLRDAIAATGAAATANDNDATGAEGDAELAQYFYPGKGRNKKKFREMLAQRLSISSSYASSSSSSSSSSTVLVSGLAWDIQGVEVQEECERILREVDGRGGEEGGGGGGGGVTHVSVLRRQRRRASLVGDHEDGDALPETTETAVVGGLGSAVVHFATPGDAAAFESFCRQRQQHQRQQHLHQHLHQHALFAGRGTCRCAGSCSSNRRRRRPSEGLRVWAWAWPAVIGRRRRSGRTRVPLLRRERSPCRQFAQYRTTTTITSTITTMRRLRGRLLPPPRRLPRLPSRLRRPPRSSQVV